MGGATEALNMYINKVTFMARGHQSERYISLIFASMFMHIPLCIKSTDCRFIK